MVFQRANHASATMLHMPLSNYGISFDINVRFMNHEKKCSIFTREFIFELKLHKSYILSPHWPVGHQASLPGGLFSGGEFPWGQLSTVVNFFRVQFFCKSFS